jgi:predicted Zn-dependent peptidase
VSARVRMTAAVLAFACMPLGASATGVSSSGSLEHGGRYVISADTTVAASSIALWFRAPSAGYDNANPGIGQLAATAAAAATLESGTSLVKFVRSLGGRLTINVYPDITGISVLAPAAATRRIVAALSAAYFSPSIDADALKIALQDTAVLAVERRYSSDDVLHDALFAELFSEGPAHVAPLPDGVKELTNVPLSAVVAYAKRAFRSANATLTLAGNVDSSSLDAVTSGVAGSPDAPLDSTLANSPQASTTITGQVAGTGIAWTGPPIRDEKAATALDFVADYLFRDGTGQVAREVNTDDTYVNGQFITLHDPGVMLVTIGGTKVDSAQTSVIDGVRKLEEPMDPRTFASAREAFLFRLAADAQTPNEQTDNLGWYAAEGNLQYAPSDLAGEYWTVARSLDPQYVASVVKRYLDRPVVVHLMAVPQKESNS